MAIGFKNYPGASNRLPGVFAEIDPSKANTGVVNLRALIWGQITSAGTGVANVPVISQGVADAKIVGGPGSQLALMLAQYRARDPFGTVYLMPIADNGAGVAATGTLAFTAAPTAAGVINLYIAGQRVQQAVTSGMATTAIATALAATVNALGDLPVTATVSTSTVTLTAKNKGLCGNDIDLRLNYAGAAGGEVMPTGLAVTITAMASGATNPTLTTAITNLGDTPFEFHAIPWNDSTSLNNIDALMDDAVGRWGWLSALYGHAFAAYRGTISALTTFGLTRNGDHISVMGFNDSPTPYWLWAADVCGACAVSVRADPALPFQTIPLGVLAPPPQSCFIPTDRNTLLFDGISTFKVNAAGQVSVERIITTNQTNAAGQADNSFLDAETLFTLAYVVRDIKSFVATTFARVKLVSDATIVQAGSNIVTAGTVRAAIIARYIFLEQQGYVQNSTTFAQGILVENAGGGLLKVLAPVDLANQLRQIAMLVQFVKS